MQSNACYRLPTPKCSAGLSSRMILPWPSSPSDWKHNAGCVTSSCICRLMQRLHMRWKKDHSCQRTGHTDCITDTSAIPHEYRTQLATRSDRHLKFIGESGCNIATTRRWGRAQYGRRVREASSTCTTASSPRVRQVGCSKGHALHPAPSTRAWITPCRASGISLTLPST